MMTELDLIYFMIPKLVVATICGFIIGFERELKHKTAGIRTHIIVCVGSCLFTSSGFILSPEYHTDPTRIIGQIVTGLGFLAGAVVFKHDDKIIGITSAAFIWLIASIGVFIGIGYLFSSLIFTIGLLFMLLLLKKFEDHIIKDKEDAKEKE